ncbi:helix-turn-helix domain-containing protein [Dubosiella muris]|uniref:XRE family transcriptional regulator n=1 Tax=Dubosiella muris TaxID=3038133 RepID=A0AC61R8E4_9FIRM|nr:helix-turn-helix transcriptional regulator [Dubosiella muris]TGY66509.1 XRE family transcriptional regulator [Dubosiella muris]
MHEFSEMYGRLTAGRTIRVYEMADYCQIAPQSLYQILNGKRKPTSVELVQRIADYIQVDPIGREQLLDAYFMTLWGKDVYDRRKEVTNFLNAVHENKSALPCACDETRCSRSCRPPPKSPGAPWPSPRRCSTCFSTAKKIRSGCSCPPRFPCCRIWLVPT